MKASTSLVLEVEAVSAGLALGEVLASGEAEADGDALGDAEAVSVAGVVGDAEAATDGEEDGLVALGCWQEVTANAIEIGSNNRVAKCLDIF